MSLDDLETRTAPLLRPASEGDPEAFGKLYDVYVEAIHRRVAHKIRNRADAEDVTEQAFVKALQHISSFDPRRGPFLAWLSTIADHLVIDYHRARRDTAVLDEGMPIAAADNPEEDVVRMAEADELRRAMAGLSEEHQEVLFLRLVAGYSVRDVATLIGKGEGAVRTTQYRALQALRKRMAEDRRP